jgi:hypothetical protein
MTQLSGFSSVINWDASFTQAIQPMYACENNTSAQVPKILSVDIMTGSLNVTGLQEMAKSLPSVNIIVDGITLVSLYNLERITRDDNIKAPTEITSVTASY